MNIWQTILSGVLKNAALGASGAIESGSNWKSVAIAGLAGGLAGALQGLLAHPDTQAAAGATVIVTKAAAEAVAATA